jgi:hypothetical protein
VNWEDGFAALVKFKQREGHCRVPRGYREGDYKLGTWVSNQRPDADKMPPDRKSRLDQLGFVWNARTADWENGFAALEKFEQREGHCRVPQTHIEGGYKLGAWISNQRTYANEMPPDRKSRLDKLGFVWNARTANWEDGFAALVKFKQREDHCRVPPKHIEGDYKLGIWVSTQRTYANKMPPDRKSRLDKLGFVWDPYGLDWENGYAALVKFKQREDHCRVPPKHIEGDYKLGVWVVRQRAAAEKLLPERRRRLDELGFVWDSFGPD